MRWKSFHQSSYGKHLQVLLKGLVCVTEVSSGHVPASESALLVIFSCKNGQLLWGRQTMCIGEPNQNAQGHYEKQAPTKVVCPSHHECALQNRSPSHGWNAQDRKLSKNHVTMRLESSAPLRGTCEPDEAEKPTSGSRPIFYRAKQGPSKGLERHVPSPCFCAAPIAQKHNPVL